MRQTGGFVRRGRKCYDPGKTQDCEPNVKRTWKYPALPVINYTLGRSVGQSAVCSFCENLECTQHRRREYYHMGTETPCIHNVSSTADIIVNINRLTFISHTQQHAHAPIYSYTFRTTD